MSTWPEKAEDWPYQTSIVLNDSLNGDEFVSVDGVALDVSQYEHAAKCVNSHDRLVKMVLWLLQELPKGSLQGALLDAELEKLK